MTTKLTKGGSNWVSGDRFFNRTGELATLMEWVEDGDHTLITAQRRMGKTSLVRELLSRLDETGEYETLFVDLEGANDAANAIADIAFEAQGVHKARDGIDSMFSNFVQGMESLSVSAGPVDLKLQMRGGVNIGNWRETGNEVFASLAESEKPVVLAIDELPILVNRMLKGQDGKITPERREAADLFLSWLRMNGQNHRDKVILIVSGSIGLEPILHQAGLSANANFLSPFKLRAWNRKTASECLQALARNYGVSLSEEVLAEMCERLRQCVPHHVQQFFDHLSQHLQYEGRTVATPEDVALVYRRDMLGAQGQTAMLHYEERLKMALGDGDYPIAIELLTEAAVNDGTLTESAIRKCAELLRARGAGDPTTTLRNALDILQHDGYLERSDDGYRYVSGLLQDWWRARHGAFFTRFEDRR